MLLNRVLEQEIKTYPVFLGLFIGVKGGLNVPGSSGSFFFFPSENTFSICAEGVVQICLN